LLEEIKSEHELLELHLQAAFLHSRSEGELILELKGMLSPEKFEQWLQCNGVLEKEEAELCMKLSKCEQVKVRLKLGEELGSEELRGKAEVC